jgi:hypothetical protein
VVHAFDEANQGVEIDPVFPEGVNADITGNESPEAAAGPVIQADFGKKHQAFVHQFGTFK